jgi:hypothetical protein
VALRTDNSRSDVIIADGVSSNHRATDVLSGAVVVDEPGGDG